MRHCLYLVATHYTEPRLLQIRGQVGWEPIKDFQGSQLLGQTDVRVFPGSIQPMTRQAIQDRLNFLITAFPGAISIEQAQAALEGGTAEDLIRGYELDVARAWRIVQKIKLGPEILFNQPPRMEYDPVQGPREVPAWMPRKQDNLAVHFQVFGDYLKTDDYDNQPPDVQEAFNLYYAGLEYLKLQKEQQAAQQQQAMAEGLGMQNAAKPHFPRRCLPSRIPVCPPRAAPRSRQLPHERPELDQGDPSPLRQLREQADGRLRRSRRRDHRQLHQGAARQAARAVEPRLPRSAQGFARSYQNFHTPDTTGTLAPRPRPSQTAGHAPQAPARP
jgi:hypothetical protein